MAVQKFGITTLKDENFSEWYTQVVVRGELIDYYDIRGCFIMRPASMFMWSFIRTFFDHEIQKLGVQECYFPMLVPKKNIEQEKDHLANFNPELAWITKCGDKDIDEPVAIRPTSETIIYPSFAKWLHTYRDLPLKINQWCSVLRWEVKSTLPFIRGREFLWQEGHTAYFNKKDAEEETMRILNLYRDVYENILAVPVTRGRKSKNETFGGAEYTLSIEAFIPGTGKGVQAATSHHLGQNFAKMFGIKVDGENTNEEKSLVYQNCWGLTTRSLGIAIMVHSDNKGFVCPPRIAQIQAVIVLCGIKTSSTKEEIEALKSYADNIYSTIKSSEIRVHFDDRDNISPGYKFNHWELRGVPLRIEIGFKDMNKNEMCIVRRDNGNKRQAVSTNCVQELRDEINAMHSDLFSKALAEKEAKTKYPEAFDELNKYLNDKCIVLAPWCNSPSCEDSIGERTTVRENGEVILMGAKSLCIPLDNNSCDNKKCINCGDSAKCFALFGRSY